MESVDPSVSVVPAVGDNSPHPHSIIIPGTTATSEDSKPEAVWKPPLWKLILMALPQLGVQVMWAFLGPNSAPYMVHLGMGHSLATLNNVAGPIVGFFTGPIVGAWSDRCTSRFGRRRPVILVGLISTWVAGLLFSASERLISGEYAVAFATPMFWVLDVTINVLQTPNRALVADLASEEQQMPLQVVFVCFMAVGNFIGFSIMKIYAVPTDHMFELMLIICAINTVCIGVQFAVAREVPLARAPEAAPGEPKCKCKCEAIMSIVRSVKDMPFLLYHLALVQVLVWVGNTAWNNYGAQWFANVVFEGDQHAPEGSPQRIAYGHGVAAFSTGGQFKSGLQLISSLTLMAILLKTTIRPRLVYAPCIFLGGAADFLAAFAVGTSGVFAIVCMAVSTMPETGSFAIPFGLVAILNKHAEEEGKQVSTALQMALLNCCITVGQQICTVSLAALEASLPLETALMWVMILAGIAHTLAGFGALSLNDKPPAPTIEDERAFEQQPSTEC